MESGQPDRSQQLWLELRRVESELAVVLRRTEYGESDLVISFYCETLGKVSAVARGARRSRKRFGAALGIFTEVEIALSIKPAARMWVLESAVPVVQYDALAVDIACLAHGSYGTELVRELTIDEFPDSEVFSLLVNLYRSLQTEGAKAGRLRLFELRLLDILGLTPVFSPCASCGSEDLQNAQLDAEQGGVICEECAIAAQSRRSTAKWVQPIDSTTVEFLLQAQAIAQSLAPFAAGDTLDHLSSAIAGRQAMLSLIYWHVGKPLKSVQFIAKISKQRTHS